MNSGIVGKPSQVFTLQGHCVQQLPTDPSDSYIFELFSTLSHLPSNLQTILFHMPSLYGFLIFLINTTILSTSNLMNLKIIVDMLLSVMYIAYSQISLFHYRFSFIFPVLFPEAATSVWIIATSLFPPSNFHGSSIIY